MIRRSWQLVQVLCLTFSLAAQDAAQAAKPPIQGITISTHGIGHDWGSDAIVPCMESIRSTGANWVSLHPYASIHRSGRVTWRAFDPKKPPAYLVRPIREAQRLGMKVFIKPHLAYWGSPFKWRGEITFTEADDWNRFFKSYTAWILAVAEACEDADGFAIGTELDRTLRHEKRWRDIIRGVRCVTKAPLTYAANWTDYRRVGFWDALDIIGIQAYFPVAKSRSAEVAELTTGWKRTMATLRAYAARHRRNIVFTELGYNTAFDTAITPWESRSDGAAAAAFQRRCTEVALRAIAAEPRVEGAFLWKWFPPPRSVGRNFPLATPEMMATLRTVWKRARPNSGRKRDAPR